MHIHSRLFPWIARCLVLVMLAGPGLAGAVQPAGHCPQSAESSVMVQSPRGLTAEMQQADCCCEVGLPCQNMDACRISCGLHAGHAVVPPFFTVLPVSLDTGLLRFLQTARPDFFPPGQFRPPRVQAA